MSHLQNAQPKDISRCSALDGLRGYAALIVVFFHSILEIKPTVIHDILKKPIYMLNSINDLATKFFLILFNGHAAVALFFVLSGAVLMRSLQRNQESHRVKLLLKFSTQRFLRIYPALVVCLIAVYWLSNQLYFIFPDIFHTHFSIHQFWKNFFLFDTEIHGASWTLQVEMIAIPFMLLTFFWLKKDRFFGVFFVLTLLYGTVFAIFQPIGFFCFVLGVVLTSSRASHFFSSLHPASVVFFLFFTLAIKHFFPQDESLIIKGIKWFLQSIFVFGLVGFVYYNHRGIFIKWLNHPISQYLGRISYSLYLFNLLGLHAFIAATQYYFPEWCERDPLTAGLCLGVVLSLFTIPIAHVSYEYIEKFGIKLGSWNRWLTFKPQVTSH